MRRLKILILGGPALVVSGCAGRADRPERDGAGGRRKALRAVPGGGHPPSAMGGATGGTSGSPSTEEARGGRTGAKRVHPLQLELCFLRSM